MSIELIRRCAGLLSLLVVASCSGGGASAPTPPPPPPGPALAVSFPSSGAVTTAAAITVRGQVSEPVAAVEVNGLMATSGDGFQSWRTTVQLGPGTGTLAVDYRLAAGGPTNSAATLGIERLGSVLGSPSSLHIGASGAALVFDQDSGALIEVDAAGAGNRILTGPGRGTGPALGLIADAIYDASGDTVYAIVPPDQVYEVDVLTGDRTEIVDPGNSQLFWSTGSMALDPIGDRLLIVGNFYTHLVAVSLDAATRGVRTRLSGYGVGSGVPLSRPVDLALDPFGGRALVVCEDSENVVAVDLVDMGMGVGHREEFRNGFDEPAGIAIDPRTQSVYVVDSRVGALYELPSIGGLREVSGGFRGVGSGPFFGRPTRVDFLPNSPDPIVLDSTRAALVSVDVTTGDRSTHHRAMAATGPELFDAQGIALDLAAGRALCVDRASSQIVAVALANGERTLFSSDRLADGAGTGVGFEAPQAIAIDRDRGRALVTDLDGVTAVDLATGDRSTLSESLTGQVPPKSFLDIAIDETQGLAILANDTELWQVDLATGLGHAISSAALGAGPVFTAILGIAADPDLGRALAFANTASGHGLFAVDLATGNRLELSGSTIGDGPAITAGRSLVYDADSGMACIGQDRSVLRIETLTGERREVTGTATGTGPAIRSTAGICFGVTTDSLLISSSELDAVQIVDVQSGDRVLMSR